MESARCFMMNALVFALKDYSGRYENKMVLPVCMLLFACFNVFKFNKMN